MKGGDRTSCLRAFGCAGFNKRAISKHVFEHVGSEGHAVCSSIGKHFGKDVFSRIIGACARFGLWEHALFKSSLQYMLAQGAHSNAIRGII